MKKILIVLMIILFILGMKHTVVKEFKHDDAPPQSTEAVSENTENGNQSVSISITATGDFTLATDTQAPTDGSFVSELKAQNNDYDYFLRNVKEYFEDDDLTIINFEGTLSENGSRADKQFAFRGKPEYINIISNASIEAANIANNHTLDYGKQALEDTKKIISDNNITVFGGETYAIVEKKGIKIGLIGTNALNAAATENFEPTFDALKSENPDMIIAVFHWGVEKQYTPTEQQINLAHKAIDLGADLVLGHHPHVLQGIEQYNGKTIVYSLGNFCFGGNRNSSDKDTMIFKKTFNFKDKTLENDDTYEIIPCSISSVSSRNNYQPTPLSGSEKTRVENKIKSLCDKIKPQ